MNVTFIHKLRTLVIVYSMIRKLPDKKQILCRIINPLETIDAEFSKNENGEVK